MDIDYGKHTYCEDRCLERENAFLHENLKWTINEKQGFWLHISCLYISGKISWDERYMG